MLSPQQAQQYQQADAGLDELAVQQVSAVLATLDASNRNAFIDGVLEAMVTVVPPLFDVSALVASQMYETAREQAGAAGRFSVDLASPLPVEQLETSARWALTPVFEGRDNMADLVTARLEGNVPRLVREGGRQTVVDNTARDPARPRYRRQLSGGGKHCDFCTMLAGRGSVFRSEDSAGSGQHWHDNCACTVQLDFT